MPPGTCPKPHAPVNMLIETCQQSQPQARTKRARPLSCSHAFTCLHMPYMGCFDSSERWCNRKRLTSRSADCGCCGEMSNSLGTKMGMARRKTLRAAQVKAPRKNSGGLSKPVALRPEAATEKTVYTSGRDAVIQPCKALPAAKWGRQPGLVGLG